MCKFIAFGVALALSAVGTTVAFKLTHRPALAAQPIDPAILHMQLRKAQEEMELP
jgi:hypothetical protein